MNILAKQELPRERMISQGPDALSTTELIALVLGQGTKEKPVLELAKEIISNFKSLDELANATLKELCQVRGIGLTKAVQIKAAIGLGSRCSQNESKENLCIHTPKQIYTLLKSELEQEKRELFVVVLLDIRGGLIDYEVVGIGTLTAALVHPREVFYPAIRHKAASVILAHNHPSGDPTPSAQDIETTQNLMASGKLLGIPVNDHVIIGRGTYISMRSKGLMYTQLC